MNEPIKENEIDDPVGRLVLTIKKDESILIGEDIIVTYKENKGKDSISVMIVAPKRIPIYHEK